MRFAPLPVSEEDPYLYRLFASIQPEGMSANAWTRAAGVSTSFFQDVRKGRRPRADNIEKIVEAAGYSPAQFYALEAPVRTEVRGAGPVGFNDVRQSYYGKEDLPGLPLYGSAVGGEYGDIDEHIELTELHLSDVLDSLVRPARLASDREAYALTIVGDSMSPRFKPGERVAVSPRASTSIGDDVIVQLRNCEDEDERVKMVLIKELVRRGYDYIELKQHNPEVIFRIEWKRVVAMHKVMGHYL